MHSGLPGQDQELTSLIPIVLHVTKLPAGACSTGGSTGGGAGPGSGTAGKSPVTRAITWPRISTIGLASINEAVERAVIKIGRNFMISSYCRTVRG